MAKPEGSLLVTKNSTSETGKTICVTVMEKLPLLMAISILVNGSMT